MLARHFWSLIDLQPISWHADGLVCAPWLSPHAARVAHERCPLATSEVARPSQIPDTPARIVGGWYRRTDLHAPAPAQVRELIQVAGEGFGPHDHPTTELCLRAIARLAPSFAIDVGCGSGMLTQAWAASHHAPCRGVDADPAAVDQAQRSLRVAGLQTLAQVAVGRIEALNVDDMADATILANLPPVAHAALAARMSAPPRAIVMSGTTRRDAAPLLAHYRRLGMRLAGAATAGRYICATLVRV